MFTGLIETTGTIVSVTPSAGGTRVMVEAPARLANRLREGDSVAVNGTCLTALAIGADRFSADLAQETLERTTLGGLDAGATVNLELPTPAGSPLGGHVVQGHVDGVGTLLALEALHPGHEHSSDWRLGVAISHELAANVVQQGSITIDGISLTVARLHATKDGAQVEAAVIPHTYKATSLRSLKPGDRVNIETDVLARYAAQKRPQAEWLTTAYLLANGY
jgi:riboflavin synthase